MKLLLIQPETKGTLLGQRSSRGKAGLVRLSLPVVAALTPRDVDVEIVDCRVQTVNYDEPVDLVGISVLTPEAPDAYEIAKEFRSKGVKVVLGGYHTTLLPEEAQKHCDAVVVGDAEPVWSRLLQDFRSGNLQQRYPEKGVGYCRRGKDIPRPRRKLLDPSLYYSFNSVQATRGCPENCDFCSIRAYYGGKFIKRPIAEVVEEIREIIEEDKKRSLLVRLGLRKPHITFVDDNLTAHREYALDLFNAIAPLGIRWDAQVTADVGMDEELIRAAARSGCFFVSVGFETPSNESYGFLGKLLRTCTKTESLDDVFKQEVKNFHKHRISILGNFIFGFPWDNITVFDDVLALAERIELDAALFHVLTPHPGTPVRKKLVTENRIASSNWKHYNGTDVVFVPDRISPDDLQQGLFHTYEEFYKPWRSLWRALSPRPGLCLRVAFAHSMRRKLQRMRAWRDPSFGPWLKDLRDDWSTYWRNSRGQQPISKP